MGWKYLPADDAVFTSRLR